MFNTIIKHKELSSQAAALGTDDVDEAVASSRKRVSQLYDPKKKLKTSHINLNEMRVKMCQMKDVELSKLPPCEDSFRQHVKRAMWQTRILTNSHHPKPQLGNPEDFGWKRLNTELIPVLYEGQSASEILDCLVCTCRKRSCSSTTCICRQNNLPCIELCYCKSEENCSNPINRNEDDDSYSDSDCEA